MGSDDGDRSDDGDDGAVDLPQQSPSSSRWYDLHVCLIDLSMCLIDLSLFLVDLSVVLQLLAVGVIPRAQ